MRKILLLVCLSVVNSFGALTSGTYTYGAGGTYANAVAAYTAVGTTTLTGDLTLIQVGNCKETSNYTLIISLGGFRFLDSCAVPNNGDFSKGYTDSINAGGVATFICQVSGAGTFEVSHKKFVGISSSASAYVFNFSGGATNFTLSMHDCIFNGQALTGRALQLNAANIIANVYNCIFHRYQYGVVLAAVNTSTIIENCIADSCTSAGFYGNAAATWINNIGWAGVPFNTTTNATGHNNASSDSTAANYKWKAGTNGGIVMIVPDSEFVSTKISDTSAWLKLRNTGELWDNGTTPTIAANSYGIRTNGRPGADGFISIGADEFLATDSNYVSMTDIPAYKLYQRVGTIKSLRFSGVYHDFTKIAKKIQIKIVKNGTTTIVQDWITVDSILSAGTWGDKYVSVPQGGWYAIQCRSLDSVNGIIDTFAGTNKWGVGKWYAIAGQSQAFGYDSTAGYTTADDHLVMWDSALGCKHLADPMRGLGATQFPRLGNLLYANDSIPIGFVNRAVGGTDLIGTDGTCWIYRNASNHRDSTTHYGRLLGQTLNATDSLAPERFFWHQGETSAGNNRSIQDYLDSLKSLITKYQTDFNDLTMKFNVIQLGRQNNSGAYDSTFPNVREAQRLIDGYKTAKLTATTYDLKQFSDSIHLSREGQDSLASRVYKFIVNEYRGPYIISSNFIDESKKNIEISLVNNGTDLTPDNGILNFEGQRLTNAWISPDSNRKISKSKYNLYFPYAVKSIRYLHKAFPSIGGILYDNQIPPLPLEPILNITITSVYNKKSKFFGFNFGWRF